MRVRRFLAFLSVASFIACFCSCGNNEKSETGEENSKTSGCEKMLKFDEYSLETYMKPIWKGDYVYNETIMFVGETAATLLFPAEKIIEARSYDLKTKYSSQTDYIFDEEKNAIVRRVYSKMPFFTEKEFYPVDGTFHSLSRNSGILFSEGSLFSTRQICVTYIAKNKEGISAPEDQSALYEDFIKKLSDGKRVKICFYGGSITVGANGSGFVGIEPHMPGFDKLVCDSLSKIYGNDNIELVNKAVGGKDAYWGYRNIDSVVDEKPDLVILAWGMNDCTKSYIKFGMTMDAMLGELKDKLPGSAVLLVSSMLPNGDVKETGGFDDYKTAPLVEFEEELARLSDKYSCGLVKMTKMHGEMLERKQYHSMTGNNINHPTDFLIRAYAQNILFALTGKEVS